MTTVAPEREMSLNYQTAGYALAAFGAMCFSLKAVLVKLVYLRMDETVTNDIEPITLMLLRLGFSLPVYILILGFMLHRKLRNERALSYSIITKILVAGVLCFYVCTWLDFAGLQYITAQLERLLLFTYPVFVIIFGALFFKGRITRWGALAVILAYAGIGVIFARGTIATGSNVPLGSGLVLSAAVLFALYQLYSKELIDSVGAIVFTCIAMIGAATVTAIHFGLQMGSISAMQQALALPSNVYVLAACIAFFSTILPSFMIASAIERVGAQAVAIIAMIGPLATIAGAVFILEESFGLVDALGTAITMIGIGCYTLIDKRARIKARSADPEFIR